MKTQWKVVVLCAMAGVFASRKVQAQDLVEFVGRDAAGDMLEFTPAMLAGTQIQERSAAQSGWQSGPPALRAAFVFIRSEIRQERELENRLSAATTGVQVKVNELRLRLAAIRLTNRAIRSFIRYIAPAQQGLVTVATNTVDTASRVAPVVIEVYRQNETELRMTTALAAELQPILEALVNDSRDYQDLTENPAVWQAGYTPIADIATNLARAYLEKSEHSKTANEAALAGQNISSREVKIPAKIAYYLSITDHGFAETQTPEYQPQVTETLDRRDTDIFNLIPAITRYEAEDHEFDCSDRQDNDSDGTVDCDDSDCSSDPVCRENGGEVCDNQVDDDGDLLVDCDDPDCINSLLCCRNCF